MMKLKERLIVVALLFIGLLVFVSINFIASPGPGPKEPSESGPTSTVDTLEKVRARMRLDLMRFLQTNDQHTQSNEDSLHTPTASSNSISHTSPTTNVSNHSGTEHHLTFPVTSKDPWKIWTSWVKPKVFYSPDDFWSAEMNTILHALATYPVTSLELGHRGTQLKASMYLQGGQRTVFKPMRYKRDTIVGGKDDPYAGYDRHNGEIAGFHLDGILGFRLAPPVVGRKINLTLLRPLISEKLLQTFFMKDGNVCFYGRCLYCKPAEAACAEGSIMEGSVTIWLPDWYKLKTWRHPYQRTYIPGRKARWEIDNAYCQQLLQPSNDYHHLLLDITDTTVFDFLMGNADRHHFETYISDGKQARLIHIDNGKSFGNPHHDEMSILAPLKQCCRLRNSTWTTLLSLRHHPLSKLLDSSLKRDPLYPILTSAQLAAVDRRHGILLQVVEECVRLHGRDKVLITTTWS